MRKVLVFGTFDRLHPGHLNFLQQAKKYGQLFIVVARDKTVKKLKKKNPIENERERVKNLKKLKIARKVILGNLTDKYQVIKKIRPEIICLGYDQKFFVKNLPKKIKEFGLKTKIIRLKPYKPNIYKSSKIKQKESTKTFYLVSHPPSTTKTSPLTKSDSSEAK
ncbi:MAG: adenylyltransferase/cytidyltransferase family protein [Patescibacteria group bacterium]